jgi:MOSC domain-containing protein YiiM
MVVIDAAGILDPIYCTSVLVSGRVETICIAPAAQAPMQTVPEARVIAGRGIEGDRYADGAGTFSDWPGNGRHITLVEAEVTEAIGLPAAEARRNVVTRGVRLDELIGRRFLIGDVECIGQRECEPCAHLERLTRPGVLRELAHRGGLRADVAGDGTIRPGDAIRAVP